MIEEHVDEESNSLEIWHFHLPKVLDRAVRFQDNRRFAKECAFLVDSSQGHWVENPV